VPLWYDGTYFTTGFRGDLKQAEYGGVNLQIRIKDRLARWLAIVVFDPKREEALWGLAGFLEHFRVTFDGPGKHFTVRFPAPAPPGFDVELIPKRRRRGRKNDTVPRDEPPITPDERDPVTADDGS
jgi:hypothetical protein